MADMQAALFPASERQRARNVSDASNGSPASRNAAVSNNSSRRNTTTSANGNDHVAGTPRSALALVDENHNERFVNAPQPPANAAATESPASAETIPHIFTASAAQKAQGQCDTKETAAATAAAVQALLASKSLERKDQDVDGKGGSPRSRQASRAAATLTSVEVQERKMASGRPGSARSSDPIHISPPSASPVVGGSGASKSGRRVSANDASTAPVTAALDPGKARNSSARAAARTAVVEEKEERRRSRRTAALSALSSEESQPPQQQQQLHHLPALSRPVTTPRDSKDGALGITSLPSPKAEVCATPHSYSHRAKSTTNTPVVAPRKLTPHQPQPQQQQLEGARASLFYRVDGGAAPGEGCIVRPRGVGERSHPSAPATRASNTAPTSTTSVDPQERAIQMRNNVPVTATAAATTAESATSSSARTIRSGGKGEVQYSASAPAYHPHGGAKSSSASGDQTPLAQLSPSSYANTPTKQVRDTAEPLEVSSPRSGANVAAVPVAAMVAAQPRPLSVSARSARTAGSVLPLSLIGSRPWLDVAALAESTECAPSASARQTRAGTVEEDNKSRPAGRREGAEECPDRSLKSAPTDSSTASTGEKAQRERAAAMPPFTPVSVLCVTTSLERLPSPARDAAAHRPAFVGSAAATPVAPQRRSDLAATAPRRGMDARRATSPQAAKSISFGMWGSLNPSELSLMYPILECPESKDTGAEQEAVGHGGADGQGQRQQHEQDASHAALAADDISFSAMNSGLSLVPSIPTMRSRPSALRNRGGSAVKHTQRSSSNTTTAAAAAVPLRSLHPTGSTVSTATYGIHDYSFSFARGLSNATSVGMPAESHEEDEEEKKKGAGKTTPSATAQRRASRHGSTVSSTSSASDLQSDGSYVNCFHSFLGQEGQSAAALARKAESPPAGTAPSKRGATSQAEALTGYNATSPPAALSLLAAIPSPSAPRRPVSPPRTASILNDNAYSSLWGMLEDPAVADDSEKDTPHASEERLRAAPTSLLQLQSAARTEKKDETATAAVVAAAAASRSAGQPHRSATRPSFLQGRGAGVPSASRRDDSGKNNSAQSLLSRYRSAEATAADRGRGGDRANNKERTTEGSRDKEEAVEDERSVCNSYNYASHLGLSGLLASVAAKKKTRGTEADEQSRGAGSASDKGKRDDAASIHSTLSPHNRHRPRRRVAVEDTNSQNDGTTATNSAALSRGGSAAWQSMGEAESVGGRGGYLSLLDFLPPEDDDEGDADHRNGNDEEGGEKRKKGRAAAALSSEAQSHQAETESDTDSFGGYVYRSDSESATSSHDDGDHSEEDDEEEEEAAAVVTTAGDTQEEEDDDDASSSSSSSSSSMLDEPADHRATSQTGDATTTLHSAPYSASRSSSPRPTPLNGYRSPNPNLAMARMTLNHFAPVYPNRQRNNNHQPQQRPDNSLSLSNSQARGGGNGRRPANGYTSASNTLDRRLVPSSRPETSLFSCRDTEKSGGRRSGGAMGFTFSNSLDVPSRGELPSMESHSAYRTTLLGSPRLPGPPPLPYAHERHASPRHELDGSQSMPAGLFVVAPELHPHTCAYPPRQNAENSLSRSSDVAQLEVSGTADGFVQMPHVQQQMQENGSPTWARHFNGNQFGGYARFAPAPYPAHSHQQQQQQQQQSPWSCAAVELDRARRCHGQRWFKFVALEIRWVPSPGLSPDDRPLEDPMTAAAEGGENPEEEEEDHAETMMAAGDE